MGILKTLAKGFRTALKTWKVIIYLWLANFIFSILVVTPFYFLLGKDFSRSLMGDQVAKGFDLVWFGDLIYKYKNFYPAFLGWFLVPAIFFLFIFIFLNGGILGRIAHPQERVNPQNFFADCGKYFFRFFRVFLISLAGYLVVFGLIFRGVSALFRLWTDQASTEWPLIFASNLKFLTMILLFSAVRMFFDYVRVRLVMEQSKKALRATVLNFSFLGKKFGRAWILYLMVAVLGIIFWVIYLVFSRLLTSIGLVFVVAFIWQQIYILSRMWIRVLFFSTEYHFFKS
ncbi:MAG: hypothetical protein ACLFVG_07605 [Candidatus Aminicenantes bacterium]